jgi:hypothetical protein
MKVEAGKALSAPRNPLGGSASFKPTATPTRDVAGKKKSTKRSADAAS